MTVKIKWKPLLFWTLGTLAVGALSSVVGGAMKGFNGINTPSITPAPAVFSIAWTVLYLLMGVSAYLVYEAKGGMTKKALALYVSQLAVNFLWPVFFFRLHAFTFSFIWLLLLAALVIITAVEFKKIRPAAGYLLIPYILWLAFAGVLNCMVITLN